MINIVFMAMLWVERLHVYIYVASGRHGSATGQLALCTCCAFVACRSSLVTRAIRRLFFAPMMFGVVCRLKLRGSFCPRGLLPKTASVRKAYVRGLMTEAYVRHSEIYQL